MNNVTVKKSTTTNFEDLKGGEIFRYNETDFYIVVRTTGLHKNPFLLASLRNGNLWSNNSLFDDDQDSFKRIYGTLTITTG